MPITITMPQVTHISEEYDHFEEVLNEQLIKIAKQPDTDLKDMKIEYSTTTVPGGVIHSALIVYRRIVSVT